MVDSEIVPFPDAPTSASPSSSTGEIPLEQPRKLKGRHKLLQNLQRFSSSPSLSRRNRSRSASTTYHRNGASLSCVSLSQTSYAPCSSNGSTSQLYGGLNIRPTTPGPTGAQNVNDQEGNARIRFVSDASNGQSKKVALPNEVRPGSRGALVSSDPENNTPIRKPKRFDFWGKMPNELGMLIFGCLTPKEIIRCSAVCKWWHKMCYDGQLWTTIDTADYYSDISCDALMKLIMSGGPFIKDLNLRGCVQLRERWSEDSEQITDSVRNVVNFSLEGSRMEYNAIHCFLQHNQRLQYINLAGLRSVTNTTMKIIAKSCHQLRTLNVSWCSSMTATGLRRVVKACPILTNLLASEVQGLGDLELPSELFKRNALERLDLSRTDLTDESLAVLMLGIDPEIDVLEERAIVPPRRLKHIDLHQCTEISDVGVKSLAHNVPHLITLQLSGCTELTDDSLVPLIRTVPNLTHLEIEDLANLSNATLTALSASRCAPFFQHLNVSYCESLSDPGMLLFLKSCPSLRFLELDNTRISDLTLSEASYRIRKRGYDENLPRIGLRLFAFDCPNVTWVGIKDILVGNAYIPRQLKLAEPYPSFPSAFPPSQPGLSIPASGSSTPSEMIPSSITPPPQPVYYPNEIIQLKCFYGWQKTAEEHTKRVLRGDIAAASRLEKRWADWMFATEEAGIGGAGARRRRRRAREAERIYNEDDESEPYGFGLLGGRRRARSGGSCVVM